MNKPSSIPDWAADESNGPAVYRYNHLLEGTDCAWKLWLDLKPGMHVLDIGCGYGGRSVSLARHGLHVIAVDTDQARTKITRQRLESLSGEHPAMHRVVCVSRLDQLPLADQSVNLVLLPTDDTSAEIMTEISRLLAPDGQILLQSANRWGLDRQLGREPPPTDGRPTQLLGLRGYHRILKQSCSEPLSSLVLKRSRNGNLVDIHEYGQPRRQSRKPGLGVRLRDMDVLAPEFAIIGRRSSSPKTRPLISRVLDVVASSINSGHGAPVQLVQLHLSRKDKLIIEARQGAQPVIIRCALSPAGQAAEQRNATMLKHLERTHSDGDWFPRLLASGELGGVYYIAEQQFTGQALNRKHTDIKDGNVLDIATRLLELINPELDTTSNVPLSGSLYDELVTKPLETILKTAARPEANSVLRDFFQEQLYDLPIATGISHGDFSLSNILMLDDGKPALIDWEDSRESGLPLLDAFSFLNSCRMHTVHRGQSRQGKRVSYLATEMLMPREAEFLDHQYRRCRVSREAHLALVCLRWLNMAATLTGFSFMLRPEAAKSYIHDGLSGYLEIIRNHRQAYGQTP